MSSKRSITPSNSVSLIQSTQRSTLPMNSYRWLRCGSRHGHKMPIYGHPIWRIFRNRSDGIVRNVGSWPPRSRVAYSSQECSVCHYTDRSNRPNQQTFCCQVCGFEAHADHNAAINLSRRVGDTQLRACRDRTAIKAVLMQRHEAWKQQQGKEYTSPVKRRRRARASSATSCI